METILKFKRWLPNADLADSSSELLMLNYAKTGDERFFSKLYDKHGNNLYYFVVVLTNKDSASDICQRAWFKVIEKRHLFQRKIGFQAWLFTIARRIVIDDARKSNIVEFDSSIVETSTQLNDSTTANKAPDTLGAFNLALSTLPFKQKEALALQLEGFSLAEISAICVTGQETIKTRLRYARQALKSFSENTYE